MMQTGKRSDLHLYYHVFLSQGKSCLKQTLALSFFISQVDSKEHIYLPRPYKLVERPFIHAPLPNYVSLYVNENHIPETDDGLSF